jgi:hypothetical protein
MSYKCSFGVEIVAGWVVLEQLGARLDVVHAAVGFREELFGVAAVFREVGLADAEADDVFMKDFAAGGFDYVAEAGQEGADGL